MRRYLRDLAAFVAVFLVIILTPGSRVPVLPIPLPLPGYDGGLVIMPAWQQTNEHRQPKGDPPGQVPTLKPLSATGDKPIPVTGSGH